MYRTCTCEDFPCCGHGFEDECDFEDAPRIVRSHPKIYCPAEFDDEYDCRDCPHNEDEEADCPYL